MSVDDPTAGGTPTSPSPDATTRAVFRLAHRGSVDLEGARLLLALGFVTVDLVGYRPPHGQRMVFEFAGWTEMGTVAADWIQESVAADRWSRKDRQALAEEALMWDSRKPLDLTDQVAICDRVICRGATPATIQRDHGRLLRGWGGNAAPHIPIHEVRMPWRPTIAALTYTLPYGPKGLPKRGGLPSSPS